MPAPRPSPSFVHRRPEPDSVSARRQWRALADDARRLAAGAMPGGFEPLGFRHEVTRAAAFPAPRGDAMAGHVDRAFRSLALAMLNAGTPERRAIVAPALTACAGLVDDLLADIIAPQVALSRRIAGEPEED